MRGIKIKIVKFTDVCEAAWEKLPDSHKNVSTCESYNF